MTEPIAVDVPVKPSSVARTLAAILPSLPKLGDKPGESADAPKPATTAKPDAKSEAEPAAKAAPAPAPKPVDAPKPAPAPAGAAPAQPQPAASSGGLAALVAKYVTRKQAVVGASAVVSIAAGIAGAKFMFPGDDPQATPPAATQPLAPSQKPPAKVEPPVRPVVIPGPGKAAGDHIPPVAVPLPPMADPKIPEAGPIAVPLPGGGMPRPTITPERPNEPAPVAPARPGYPNDTPMTPPAAPAAFGGPVSPLGSPPSSTFGHQTKSDAIKPPDDLTLIGKPALPAVPSVIPAGAQEAPKLPAVPAGPAAPTMPPVPPAMGNMQPATPPLPALPSMPLPPGGTIPADSGPKPPVPPVVSDAKPAVPLVGPDAPGHSSKPGALPEPGSLLDPVTPKPPAPIAGSPPGGAGGPQIPVKPEPGPIVPGLPGAPGIPTVQPDLGPTLPSTPVRPIGGAPVAPLPDLTPGGTKLEFSKPPGAPVGGAERTPTTSYDVDIYEPKTGDTWEAISREFYNDTRYATGLKAYNRNKALQGAGPVDVPPLHVVKKYMQGQPPAAGVGAGGAAVTGAGWTGGSGTATPTARENPPAWGAAPAVTSTNRTTGEKTFRVPTGGSGLTMRGIARLTLGSEQRWDDILKLNPHLKADEALPAGTDVRLPPDARDPG